ncbi:MAG: HAD family hydrolase [Herbinix sp.]|nr:HAD family hydrolase [Herbinix sp.]
MDENLKRPKAILFDLDDTISSFDSVCMPAWEKCCDEFAEKYKTGIGSNELLDSINNTKKWYWSDPVRHKEGRENLKAARREVVRYSLDSLGIGNEAMAIELADHYTELQDSLISLLPNSREALNIVKELGVRMVVVTNGASKVQREKMERLGITDYFEKIVIDAEVGYSKPDKRIFKYALKQLQLTSKDVWMVGDNLVWDIWGGSAVRYLCSLE